MPIIIKPQFALVNPAHPSIVSRHIERGGRLCYKSEDKTGPGSDMAMIDRLIRMGHNSVIEHWAMSIKFIVDRGVSHQLVRHRAGISFSQESTRYCVAGQSSLSFSNPHLRMTVAELYANKVKSLNGAWRRMCIRQVDEITGEVIYSRIKDIHYTGKKNTLTLRTRLGYTLQATKDHEVKSQSGYVRMCDLMGKQVATNGTDRLYTNKDWLYHQYNTLMKTSVAIAEEFGFGVEVVKKWVAKHDLPKKPKSYFNKGRIPWNKGLTEEDVRVKKQADALRKYHWNEGHPHVSVNRKDRLMLPSERTYHKTVDAACLVCGKGDTLNVHHIDGDRGNNDSVNLVTLCVSCHQGVHNKTNKVTYYDEVVSLEDSGMADVYDIEMYGPNHNFVANGICVHNCTYSRNKFGNAATFIDPVFWENDPEMYGLWLNSMKEAEAAYMRMISRGATAQEARSVLPNSLKTEIMVTANMRQWRLVFSQRCANAAHPQIRQAMLPALAEVSRRYPILFKDIHEEMKPEYELFKKNNWSLAQKLDDEIDFPEEVFVALGNDNSNIV